MDLSSVAKHTSADDCWVILYNTVYDVTEFLPSHPGGTKIILKLAGQDATSEYDPVHPPGTLEENLPPSAKLGRLDPGSVPSPSSTDTPTSSPTNEIDPPLNELLNLEELEAL